MVDWRFYLFSNIAPRSCCEEAIFDLHGLREERIEGCWENWIVWLEGLWEWVTWFEGLLEGLLEVLIVGIVTLRGLLVQLEGLRKVLIFRGVQLGITSCTRARMRLFSV